MQEQITAALKKLGHPVSPGELARALGVEGPALGYHMKNMLDAGTLKAIGNSRGRRIGLPDQDFADSAETPAPQRGKKHKKAKHARKPHVAKKPRTARTAAKLPAARFIPTIDVDSRLVIVNGAEPHIFTAEQTEAIATLLFQHYKA